MPLPTRPVGGRMLPAFMSTYLDTYLDSGHGGVRGVLVRSAVLVAALGAALPMPAVA